MYSEDAEFWHPLFIVKGKRNIFGAHMFWASINRRTKAHIQRIGICPTSDHVRPRRSVTCKPLQKTTVYITVLLVAITGDAGHQGI